MTDIRAALERLVNRIKANGKIENHGHRRPGSACGDCEAIEQAEQALSAPVAQPAPDADLEELPERFSAAVFVQAGLSLKDAGIALMVSRRILEDAERDRDQARSQDRKER